MITRHDFTQPIFPEISHHNILKLPTCLIRMMLFLQSFLPCQKRKIALLV